MCVCVCVCRQRDRNTHLYGNVKAWDVEGLEHDLSRVLSVLRGVERRLRLRDTCREIFTQMTQHYRRALYDDYYSYISLYINLLFIY